VLTVLRSCENSTNHHIPWTAADPSSLYVSARANQVRNSCSHAAVHATWLSIDLAIQRIEAGTRSERGFRIRKVRNSKSSSFLIHPNTELIGPSNTQDSRPDRKKAYILIFYPAVSNN
jgi:hypothetical protein